MQIINITVPFLIVWCFIVESVCVVPIHSSTCHDHLILLQNFVPSKMYLVDAAVLDGSSIVFLSISVTSLSIYM